MTCDAKRRPSMVWDVAASDFGVFRDLDEVFHCDSQVFLDNVQDDSFKLIIDLLPEEKHGHLYTMDLMNLLDMYMVCDYLQIEQLQTSVAKEIAQRMNSMSLTQLENMIQFL